ncbi:integrase arm-type DNA-binding domain-containing protein [Sphingomonas sp. HF-S4]|uniref:Integrase arm-type DNA-binding domain-containing protein n=1 Tax=Sphingomonas agrestis TaxID=3080540 RepID=A0ABU3YCV4_9SPHN|nr:integrase arm-type DNA-binding domain-containing protein [Sphingomonas sp. HF-S4]MDV3459210.1 integrase arm-type DNA-binding domain-containing protein [Sphingomonas sp. HF-S4]
MRASVSPVSAPVHIENIVENRRNLRYIGSCGSHGSTVAHSKWTTNRWTTHIAGGVVHHASRAEPEAPPYRVSDSQGLFLLVQPTGALLWRFRYEVLGVERKLRSGPSPRGACSRRAGCETARADVEEGGDPAAEKRQKRLEAELAAKTTFELVATEYIQKMEREGRPPPTIKKARWFLELLGGIAKRSIASITPHELLDVLKRAEWRGHHETAIRLRVFAGRIFRYGFATLRMEKNPADILRGALTVPRIKHHAAIVEPKKVGELLRAIEDYKGRPETLYALRLAPHVFLRPSELREAKWTEIDFAEKVWRVPAERMKMKQPPCGAASSCPLLCSRAQHSFEGFHPRACPRRRHTPPIQSFTNRSASPKSSHTRRDRRRDVVVLHPNGPPLEKPLHTGRE